MTEDRAPDETYESALQQQRAEEHSPEPDAPVPAELVDSTRAHHETDADLPADEREHLHDTPPLSQP